MLIHPDLRKAIRIAEQVLTTVKAILNEIDKEKPRNSTHKKKRRKRT